MPEKPKPKPSDTYVLDEEDLDELDDMTLTSVIRDAADLPEPEPLEEDAPEEGPPDVDDLDFDILGPKE